MEADILRRTADALCASGRQDAAIIAYRMALDHGPSDPRVALDHLKLLTRLRRYPDVVAEAARLPKAWRDHRHVVMGVAHARLATAHPLDEAIARARALEQSSAWLPVPDLLESLATAVSEGRPFSFVRVGDGEARFAIAATADGHSPLSRAEASAMGAVVWSNWFGASAPPGGDTELATLYGHYETAVTEADIVGCATAARLRDDPAHYGYLAWQEAWLADLLRDGPQRRTDATAVPDIDAQSPHLARLLAGRDRIGLISPHAGLAPALEGWLGIRRVDPYLVRGERRASIADEQREPHYPDAYERLMGELASPLSGRLFLVAAGLLGKLYCARIRRSGGVAIDVGSIVDGWMGLSTRGNRAIGAPIPPVVPQAPAPTTTACLSIAKTGSMALTAALQDAGVPDALHLHYLGPRALAVKPPGDEPKSDLAIVVRERVADPNHRFRFVTCLRDPISRLVSFAFYGAIKGGDPGNARSVATAQIARWIETCPPEYLAEWFDDTLRTVFGFDFRTHPFDFERRSLRFESGRLRLVVIRLEDPLAVREAELGWLLGRGPVPIGRHNTADSEGYAAMYREFLDRFHAPAAWLRRLYDTEAMRHFYSDDERIAFRERWQ